MTSGGEREVVHLHVGVDPALEVAVAGQHRDDREVVVVDRRPRSRRAAGRSCRCRWCSRSRRGGSRASPGRATGRPSRSSPVTTLEPGRQRGLDPRLDASARARRRSWPAARRPASPRGWRCWCRGDRGDRHDAVVELERRAVGRGDRDLARRPAVAVAARSAGCVAAVGAVACCPCGGGSLAGNDSPASSASPSSVPST